MYAIRRAQLRDLGLVAYLAHEGERRVLRIRCAPDGVLAAAGVCDLDTRLVRR